MVVGAAAAAAAAVVVVKIMRDATETRMWHVMATLANIGGAVYATPQSLADAHCWSAMQ